MRARKASVSAVEVSSPRAIRRPGFGNAERREVGHGRRYSSARKTCGGSAAQAQWLGMRSIKCDQSDIALVQMLDVLRRQRQAGQRGARAKFLERWRRLRRSSSDPPGARACNRHAAPF